MNLLNLTKNASALEAIILEYAEAHDGNLDGVEEQIAAWSAETDEPLEAKLEGIARLIREWTAKATARKAEAANLTAAAKADENRCDRLKAWTKFCLESQGMTKAEAGPYTFAIQKNGGVQPITFLVENPEEWPVDYLVTRVDIDKAKVREFLTAGNHLTDLAVMGERGTSLRIK
jgi:hypothetical protein